MPLHGGDFLPLRGNNEFREAPYAENGRETGHSRCTRTAPYNGNIDDEPPHKHPKPKDDRPSSYTGAEIKSVLDDAATGLPEHLTRICLNPEIQLTSAHHPTYGDKTAAVWYFNDLLSALKILRQRFIDCARRQLAETEITARMIDTLEFWRSEPS